MEDDQSAREERQFRLMLERLRAFQRGDLALGPLISNLEALLEALEVTPEEWKDAFREEWSVLEIAYAVALDRLTPIPDVNDADLADAVRALLNLVAERTSHD